MSNAETTLKFLKGIPNGCCDDCISRETRIKPRQQVNHICRRMVPREITRRQDRCTLCSHTKIVNIIRESAGESGVAASPREARSAIPHDPHVHAKLICGKLDLTDVDLVGCLLRAAAVALSSPAAWHRLEVHRGCYFRTPDGRLPTDPGWYVICDATQTPLYVGKSESLDKRLNTTNGSLDQFLNSRRTQDPTRNFIKALYSMGVISSLRVAVVLEPDLLQRVGIQGPLEDLDRGNIEKLLSLFRLVVIRSGV